MKLRCNSGYGGFCIKGFMKKDRAYDVPDEVAEYLLATHPDKFERAHGNTRAERRIEIDKSQAYDVARKEFSKVHWEGKRKVRTVTASDKEIGERAEELWKEMLGKQE